jgi:cyclopropane fatty-acyl-phospholipid synthase-like methyltransferase
VLDVGCGAGRHIRAFASRGTRCVGLDLSATLLKVARQTTAAVPTCGSSRSVPRRWTLR